MAVAVGPLLPDDVFRPADLPTDDRQRTYARYLASLTIHTFGPVGRGVQFGRQYFPRPPSPMELQNADPKGWEQVQDSPVERQANHPDPRRL